MIQKKIFLLKSFFKEHNLHKAFYNEFMSEKNTKWREEYAPPHSFNEYIKKFIKNEFRNINQYSIRFEFFFNYAFDWKESYQGYDYWDNIRNKWVKILKKWKIE